MLAVTESPVTPPDLQNMAVASMQQQHQQIQQLQQQQIQQVQQQLQQQQQPPPPPSSSRGSISVDVSNVMTSSVSDCATSSGSRNMHTLSQQHGNMAHESNSGGYMTERKYSHPVLSCQTSNGSTSGFDRMQRTPAVHRGSIDSPCGSQSTLSPVSLQPTTPIGCGGSAGAAGGFPPIMQQQQPSSSQQQQPQQFVHASPHTPSSSDACASIVHSLMCHRQGGDEAFSRRAIESLIKKLKDKRDELDALIQSVTSAGTQVTKCVTIQRTLDGRLQVAGRKGFPHVVYARIWRYNDLHKNELKHTKICQFAFDLKLDLVCVNPYHYERVVSPGIGNLDLSALRIVEGGVKAEYSGADDGIGAHTMLHQAHHQDQFSPISREVLSADPKPSKNYDHKPNPNQMLGSFPPLDTNAPGHSSWSTQVSPNSQASFQRSGLSIQDLVQPNIYGTSVAPNWNLNNLVQQPVGVPAYLQQHIGIRMDNDVQPPPPLSSQPPPDFWCSIAYYEMDTQVGETFKVPKDFREVTIDGYVHPTSASRFCLGALSNVHRTDDIEKARIHIGRGVILHLIGEGDVTLSVECKNSVFVQSYYLDREAGRSPGDTVHKIYPKGKIKVFDLLQCYKQMHQQATNAQQAATAQAAAVAGFAGSAVPGLASNASLTANTGISVDELRRLCIIRLSFVKGWGPDYPKRLSITKTPCWIEVHLHRALQLLDEVLHSVPGLSG